MLLLVQGVQVAQIMMELKVPTEARHRLMVLQPYEDELDDEL